MTNAPIFADSPLSSARHCFAITPSDTAALPHLTKGIYVGAAGDVVVRSSHGDEDVTFRNVPEGQILDIEITHVRAAGTTASAIVGLA